MRSMWTGSISFGLVSVPVKMYPATEDHDVRFHQVHLKDAGRIRYQRKCDECGDVVEYGDIGKAYETPSGERIVLTDEDFENLPVAGAKEIDVLEFVPSDQIDPVLFDKCYYLEPEARGLKPYVLLRESLEETSRTAIVKIAMRSRQQLAALRVRGDVLCLQTMLWPDEVRKADFDVLSKDVDVRPQEMKMAASLIDNLSSDFVPSDYTDEYREALLEVIEDKIAGGKGIKVEKTESTDDGQVLDLMAALQASVERTRKERGGSESKEEKKSVAADSQSDGDEPEPDEPKTSGRRTAKKTTSRPRRKAG
jgi:DNA end-binding protein Ku